MTENNTNSLTANTEDALFDTHGRCVPAKAESAAHQETRRHFVCPQPEINYHDIYNRIATQLGDGPGQDEFQARSKAILNRLASNPRTANLLHGAHVPFMLPKATHLDIGQALDQRYLPAVAESFEATLPDYAFVNHHKGGLTGKLSVAPQSRHQHLLDMMSKDDVVGIYLPCLLEYSIPAARRQVEALPQEFLLAGGVDTCAALIGSPNLLFKRDSYPPLLWMAALNAENENVGYHFEAYGYNLTFNRRPHLGQAAEYWANGLVVLG
jgi:hypothetical protein